ncbi:MAG: TetR/AcrR family transcriptional regulator [Variovorax paradoxus]|nr:MAG: TetR/AcrR family transcriptional regulator [Variovorax paradoxus]PZQ00159.1 MAG: TetR/AcrR family transcriptional regulator [Variovorax paradoxus]
MNPKTPSKRGRPSARDKILDATLALVKEIGAPAITLDLVAERAQVSKGGLLYHFRFKDQLMRAANERLIDRRRAARAAVFDELPADPNRALKAYVLACVNNRAGNDAISARLLSAGSMLDESAEPIRQHFKQQFPPFAADVGFDRAALVHAATEGLWFMEMHGVSPFSEQQREALVKIILSVVDGSPLPLGAPPAPAPRSTAIAGEAAPRVRATGRERSSKAAAKTKTS